jgi:UDP-glucose:(heptosyl)LPS alpha-1,3-glucosyltransferase
MHPFGGAGGVAYFLKAAFDRKGIPNSAITLPSLLGWNVDRRPRRNNLYIEKALLIIDMVFFSIVGSFVLLFAKKEGTVIINHGDPLGGDILIDHGIHKAMVKATPKMLLRNPLHLFIFLREETRHRIGLYRRMVCLSDYARRVALDCYPHLDAAKILNIPNGIDLDKFAFTPEGRRQRVERLIFIGHEFERKGLVYVLDALALLPDHVSLQVVGGSEQEIKRHSGLVGERGLTGRVTFLGRRNDVPALLADSDVLVFPSKSEAWQLVVLEAMACGVPVLSTPVGCAPEVIRDGENGYLIERDGAMIADRLRRLDADLPGLRARARETAIQYSWDGIADRYLALVKRIEEDRVSA